MAGYYTFRNKALGEFQEINNPTLKTSGCSSMNHLTDCTRVWSRDHVKLHAFV